MISLMVDVVGKRTSRDGCLIAMAHATGLGRCGYIRGSESSSALAPAMEAVVDKVVRVRDEAFEKNTKGK